MPEWREKIRERLAGLKLAPAREAEIVEELSQHLADRYEELMGGGASEDHAYRAALAELSGSQLLADELKRVEHQARSEPAVLGAGRKSMTADLIQDLRYCLRLMRKSPVFTLAAVLSLALGIGSSTAIFSVIDALMLRTLPVSSPEQLVTFEQVFLDGPRQYNFSYLDFERFKEMTDVFSSLSATSWADAYNVRVNGNGGGVDEGQARVSLVTGNYFSVLGVGALVGRTLTENDDRVLGRHPVVVISDSYWERRLGRAADVVGRTLMLNGTTYDIIGVTPRGFSGDWVGWPTDLWIPTAMISQVRPELGPEQPRSRLQYKIIARLKPDATIQQAQAAGDVFYRQLQKEPPSNTGVSAQGRLEIASAARGYSPQRESFARPLTILMIAVGAVMLIACANVANLLLARTATRKHEIAVRLAVGARRGRIVRQLLTESFLLAAFGGALGLLFAWWGTDVLAALVRSGPVGGLTSGYPIVDLDLHLDLRMLVFTAGLCVLTGMLFGLAPALRSSKVSLAPVFMRRSGNSTDTGGMFGLSKLLVIAQVASSLVLLVGTGLFVRTLSNLKSQDLGFDREHLLLVWTHPGQAGRSGAELASFWEIVQERISSLPGVVSASPSVEGLLAGGSTGGPLIQAEGSQINMGEETRVQATMTVGPGFFETVGQPLLAGREFTRGDKDSAQLVVVINASLAHHFFGDEDPVGRRLIIPRSTYPPMQIVGVVNDTRHNLPRASSKFMLYYPPGQNMRRLSRSMCLSVRASGDPTAIAATVRQELRDIDPNLPVLKIDTVEEQLDDVLFQERLIATLSAFFAGLAVLLACIGLYGVISYTVARRTNEIGIRMALGATPSNVLRMVIRESMALVLAGVVIGIWASLATTRLVSAVLFGVSAVDPLTIAAAALLLIAVATLAAFLPSRRASKVDPLTALRYE